MNVVVFGASGFVGRNVVDRLKDEHEITATDLVSTEFPSNVTFTKSDITYFEGVCDIIEGCDVVIHLAASSLVTSLKDPVTDIRINVGGTLNILEACRKHNVNKVIYSSASSLVGEIVRSPVDEKHPCNPKTPYGVSKLAVEHYLKVYKEVFDLDYLIFRFFNLYGPHQYPAGGSLIPNIFRRILNNEPVTVFGDGSAVRDFIYIGDVVEFYAKALESDVKNEVVNLGTGKGSTIMDVINGIAEVTGKEPNIEYKPPRKGEIANFVADVTKLKALFGTVPQVGLKEGLERTYEWFRKECL